MLLVIHIILVIVDMCYGNKKGQNRLGGGGRLEEAEVDWWEQTVED